MKIYEYIKNENKKTIKILGFPIMKQDTDYMTAERYQHFMGGLVSTTKANDFCNNYSNKDIKILGQSIIRVVKENDFINYYFLNKKIRSISLIEEFKNKFIKYFDKKHDDIYILNANSGEIYLVLTYIINSLIKRNQSKNPLLVATQKYHIDMIKVICPHIPCVYIGKIDIGKDEFQVDNFKFHLLFSTNHLKQTEMKIKSNSKENQNHYFKSILNKVNVLEDDIQMNNIVIQTNTENEVQEKAQEIGLNLDKFVFLAPEAKSCRLLDEDFWESLINKLQEKGYDVFVNLVGNDIQLQDAISFKTCNLGFAEAFALAKKAKKIISLRSGFTEFLLQTDVKMDVLYTKFRHRHFFDDMGIEQTMSGFGLFQLPFINKENIKEFNMVEMDHTTCINKILENI